MGNCDIFENFVTSNNQIFQPFIVSPDCVVVIHYYNTNLEKYKSGFVIQLAPGSKVEVYD